MQPPTTIRELIDAGKQLPEDSSHVDVKALRRITPALKKLDKLVGVDHVKKEILDICMYALAGLQQGDYLHTVITGPPGCGKCLGKGTPVRLYNGEVKSCELVEVGDLLIGDDLLPRRVVSTCAGVGELIYVVGVYGTNYVVNLSHILTLYTDDGIADVPISGLVNSTYASAVGVRMVGAGPQTVYELVSLSRIGPGEYYGWELAADNPTSTPGRFLLADGTVTHNTTISGILGDIYCGLRGEIGRVTIANRSTLVGKYCGHTAVQTREAVTSAQDGVLLIDEAYSLGGREDKVDTFSKECVDTLNQCLSESGHKFVCVVVGYKKSLESSFFSVNPGLKRRFSHWFDLSISQEALYEIFSAQARIGGLRVKFSAEEFLRGVAGLPMKFGGGDTSRLLHLCKVQLARRYFGKRVRKRITSRELKGAAAELVRMDTRSACEGSGPGRDSPPEGMYS